MEMTSRQGEDYKVRSGFAQISFPELAGRSQSSDLPTAIRTAHLLPFTALDPEVFERVVAEIIYRQDNSGAYFYGRRGQKQHGLDIVEFKHDDSRTLYQVKRYKSISEAGIRKAVTDFTGAPRQTRSTLPERPYSPRKFIVVTSAEVAQDTKKTDAIREIKRSYSGDVEIEVWGAERLTARLRDAPNLVFAIFGPAWADQFCGYRPSPPSPKTPTPLGLVESPIDVLNLRPLRADADHIRSTTPLESAYLLGRLAGELEAANFPGHASDIKQDQAKAAREGQDFSLAFTILFDLALEKLLDGQAEAYGSFRLDLDVAASQCGQREQQKKVLIESIAAWAGEGSNLHSALPALQYLAEIKDSDLATLCCLTLEGCVVDGLFELELSESLVATPALNTWQDLLLLRNLAETLHPTDVTIRARLRCAVADATLPLASPEEAVEMAFRSVLDDALGGRYLHASGLVSARAAYAFAIRGFVRRATNLWRNSILANSEHKHYGDAREAMVSSWRIELDSGIFKEGFTAVARALPNRDRLIGGNRSAALFTLSETQREKWNSAFVDARRWIWESRLGGHLHDEYAATAVFGDILVAADELPDAVLAYVRAGSWDKAAATADRVEALIKVDRWLSSPIRRRRAAAIQVVKTQASLVPDTQVAELVSKLIASARDVWTAHLMQPTPERNAIRALSAFGLRLTDDVIEQAIALASPAFEKRTGVSEEIFELLMNLYCASEQSREKLAPRIESMLKLADPYDRQWGWINALPHDARGPLIPAVRALAESGNDNAILALAQWRDGSAPVQLFARRAVATILRKNLANPQNYELVDPNGPQTAELLLALFECSDLAEFNGQDLTAEDAAPIEMVRFRVLAQPEDERRVTQRDVSSRNASQTRPPLLAIGTPDALANAVVRHLISTAEKTKLDSEYRVRALDAIRRLVSKLSPQVNLDLAKRLKEVHAAPSFTDQDLAEMATDRPLSASRIRGSAPYMPAIALLASAEALAAATERPLGEHHLVFAGTIMNSAMALLRDEKPRIRRLGARAITALTGHHRELERYAYSLFSHEDDEVRAIGASAAVDQSVLGSLARDPSFKVRAAIASKSHDVPDHVRESLSNDVHFAVRLAAGQAHS